MGSEAKNLTSFGGKAVTWQSVLISSKTVLNRNAKTFSKYSVLMKSTFQVQKAALNYTNNGFLKM